MNKYYHELNSPMGNIYTADGWINMSKVYNSQYTKCIIVAGRGTGKTYGMFDTIYKEKIPSIYLRRTQDQLETCFEPLVSPIFDYAEQSGAETAVQKLTKNSGGFWDNVETDDDGNAHPVGLPLGLIMGLSTAYKVRSMSGLRYKLLFFDEFIGEAHERPIKREPDALRNLYETVNRNRELQGEPPLKLIMASNSNDIYNPHLLHDGLVPVLERMQREDKGVYIDEDRSMLVLYPMHSPISQAKGDTYLYKDNSDMRNMAINNQFSGNDLSEICRKNLQEYRLLAIVGSIGIYGHKSKLACYYCTHVISGATKQVYDVTETGLIRFRAHWKARLLKSRVMGLLNFSDAETAGMLTEYTDF